MTNYKNALTVINAIQSQNSIETLDYGYEFRYGKVWGLAHHNNSNNLLFLRVGRRG